MTLKILCLLRHSMIYHDESKMTFCLVFWVPYFMLHEFKDVQPVVFLSINLEGIFRCFTVKNENLTSRAKLLPVETKVYWFAGKTS